MDENGKLVFYRLLRVSSQGQRDRYGLPAQCSTTEVYMAKLPNGPHSIGETATVIERATAWTRDDWEAAVSRGVLLSRSKLINAFLLPRVDRETRNLFSSVPILRWVLDAGIPVHFAEENICLTPNDPEAIEKYLVAAGEAAAYVRKMTKITKGGRISRAKKGKHPTSHRMFGFDMVDGKRIPKTAEAQALREAIQMALKQGRLGPAAEYLNGCGFRTIHGGPFTADHLRDPRGLFRNPALIGETTIRFKEETVVIYHEGIVDRTTFEQLQAMLRGPHLRKPRSVARYALRGIAYCSICGSRLAGWNSTRRYYRCGQCRKVWGKEKLEMETWSCFLTYLERKETQQAHLQLATQTADKLKNDLKEIERRIAQNNREWRTLLDKELANYPELIVKDKKRELTAEQDSLQRAKVEVEQRLEDMPQINPTDLRRAFDELRKPLFMANRGGYNTPDGLPTIDWPDHTLPHPMCWGMLRQDTPLSDDQLKALSEILLRLRCQVTVQKQGRSGCLIKLRGEAPITVGVRTDYSRTAGLLSPRSTPRLEDP
jgi:hypothetical protein